MFEALANRNYRLYFSGGIVSNVGTWAMRIAQDLLVAKLSHNNGTVIGIVTGLQFLPVLLLSLWGGVLADRFPKRSLLMLTQLGLGITSGALGLLDVAGVVQIWHVYLLAFLFGVVSAIDAPARQAFVSEMVGGSALPNAVGLNSASFNAARLIGPGVAGLLIGVFGTGPVMLGNAVSYLFVIAALAAMRAAELTPPPRRPGEGALAEGLRYLRSRPDLVVSMCIVGALGTFGMNISVLTLLMATKVFGVGSAGYGLLGTITAVGSLTAAVLGARRTGSQLRWVVAGASLFAIVLVVSAFMPTYLTYALVLIPVGFASITALLCANVFNQLSAGARFRGRVMSVHMLMLQGGTPLGAPLVGWVGQHYGPREAIVFCGVTLAVGIAAPLLWYRHHLLVRHFRLETHLWPHLGVSVVEPLGGDDQPSIATVPIATVPIATVPVEDAPVGAGEFAGGTRRRA
jgi:MFS family permease